MKMQSRRSHGRINELSFGADLSLNIIMGFIALLTVLPLLLVVVVSFSSSESITYKGYSFFPSSWSLQAYTSLAKTGQGLLNSYLITIFYTAAGTALSLLVTVMFAFVLIHKRLVLRKAMTFFAFFTTLFGGGLVPSYILNVRYLHLNDTVWIFLLPGMVSAINVIILRTFMQTSIPESLFEAARIDGANDWLVFCDIALPLCKAGMATIALFNVVGRWNDWFTGILYIENPKLVPLQTLLQRLQNNLDFIKQNADIAGTADGMEAIKNIPMESTRMAITIITILPLLAAYPFFQRYFVKGLTIGSVKG